MGLDKVECDRVGRYVALWRQRYAMRDVVVDFAWLSALCSESILLADLMGPDEHAEADRMMVEHWQEN